MLKKFLKPTTLTNRVSIAILLLRLGLASLLLTHGYGKLQDFLTGDHDFPDPLHLNPVISQGLTVFAEFFCSILLIIGLFSRMAAAVLVICMMVIAFMVHGKDHFVRMFAQPVPLILNHFSPGGLLIHDGKQWLFSYPKNK